MSPADGGGQSFLSVDFPLGIRMHLNGSRQAWGGPSQHMVVDWPQPESTNSWWNLRCSAQVKAYTTRVGAGPYPTEVHGALAEDLRRIGAEYGTTTGRPRRVGWLDIPALRYAARFGQ